MAETVRFIAMLRASASQNANVDKSKDRGQSSYRPLREVPTAARKPTSVLLLAELIHSIKNGAPLPSKPLNTETKEGLDRILDLLNNSLLQTPTATPVTHLSQHKSTSKDFHCATHLSQHKPTSKDFHCATHLSQHKPTSKDFHCVTSTCNLNTTDITIPLDTTTMANRFPALTTSDLPRASTEEQSATASPARGTAMLNSIFKSVRVPEFRFKWLFWAEKGQAGAPASKAGAEDFASRPKPLGDTIISVKEFYQHFNNIPVENLKLRDSIHLFHLGVKPVWEDPRNVKGGAWYFKVSKDVASQFWHEMCLLAVGDILQGAVETKRVSFNDDICGISYSVRWNAVQIAVWNRDADNEAGKEKLLAVILDKLSEELRPKKEDSYWYKAHREHKGFIEQ